MTQKELQIKAITEVLSNYALANKEEVAKEIAEAIDRVDISELDLEYEYLASKDVFDFLNSGPTVVIDTPDGSSYVINGFRFKATLKEGKGTLIRPINSPSKQ